jgi:hypothetical protein
MALIIRNELDFTRLVTLKNNCLRIRDREGLSERYWLARKCLGNEVESLEAQRLQDTRAVVAKLGKRLETYDRRQSLD